MVTGITRSGFSFEVSEEVVNDMELLEALAEMQDKDITAMPKVCKFVLGNAQKRELYEHLRTEDGRVPIDGVSDAITDIFNALGKKGKNS